MRLGSRQRETTSHRYINNTKHNVKISMYIHVFIIYIYIFFKFLLLNIGFTALGCAPDGEPMPGGELVHGGELVSGGEPPVPTGLCS